MSKEYEVIVIGGGIMGSTTAYYLSKHFGPGKVLLLEQFDWLHRKGSSHGESRIIRRTYRQEHYTFLMKDAYTLWKEAEKESNTKVFTQAIGGIDFCKEHSPDLSALISGAIRHNIPFEILDSTKIKEKFPTITLPPGFVGLFSQDSGVLNATKAVSMFHTLARLNGCDLRDNCTVVNIEDINSESTECLTKVVTKTGEQFLAKKCIVLAGAWTGKLIKENFKIEIPIQPIETVVTYWKVDDPQIKFYSAKNFPIFIFWDEPYLVYGTPLLEFQNLIKCGGHGGPICDPDHRNFKPDMSQTIAYVQPFLKDCLKGVDYSSPAIVETCLYTLSPDEDFIIDALPANPNILIGCGFSRHGFKLAPIVGKILAELAISEKHPYPNVHEHFELSRFDKLGYALKKSDYFKYAL